jgi:enoyl-CoA hydratase/carnithine racemase
MGAARVREILMTARLIEAEEAKAIGLVSEIAEDVDARAGELAATLASHAPLTLRATKEGLRRLRAAAAHVDDRDLIAMCYMSADFREGLEAFLSKRKPAWSGT